MATSPNLLITHITQGQNQKSVTHNTAIDALDDATSDHRTDIDFPSDAHYTPTAATMRASYSLDVGGTLSASTKNLIVPDTSKNYLIQNSTSGGQSILVKTSGGSGVTIPNGERILVFCDGTNVVLVSYAGGGVPYDVYGYVEGEPSLTSTIFTFVATRDISFADDFGGSEANVETAPDASTVFDIEVNSTPVGDFTFATSANTATFTTDSGALTLLAGDTLEIHSPADINIAANLAFTFQGSLV